MGNVDRKLDHTDLVASFMAAMMGVSRDGECYYCRNGMRTQLYKHTTGAWSGGDFVPDDEWVCFGCYCWLNKIA